jgi:hypothetical protein
MPDPRDKAEEYVLSDDLLRQLVAVGNVDLLVGVPTLNHASTITSIVRAVHASFSTYFSRQRTVLINSDGGSSDSTPAIVRDCGVDEGGTVTAKHGLRTTHRISTPYHGMPGKGNALRLIFAAADLLQAGTVVVLDPDVASVTPEWVAALARPIREQRFDFTAPVYPRHPADGLLVTQIVRPLVRALYGWRLREPLVGEFGCSGRFAAHCVEQPVWDTELARHGVDLWISGTALAGFRTCQAWVGPRLLTPGRPRPGLPELFQQVVGSTFQTMETHAQYWLTRTAVEEVPLIGAPLGEAAAPTHEGARLADSFARDVKDLEEILRAILSPETFTAVVEAAAGGGSGLQYPDELWATTVCEFLVAYRRSVMRRDHVTQALLPLYVARTGTFLMECASSPHASVDAALESLCERFQRLKGGIAERWNQPA